MPAGDAGDPHVAAIYTYPVKSLDAVEREEASVSADGGLSGDREYALFDDGGEYVNGKRERRVHRLDSAFDLEKDVLELRSDRASPTDGQFVLTDDADRAAAAEWLREYFGYEIEIRRDAAGYPDDTVAAGPTLIATATIAEVASWFSGITPDEMRRRLRPNIEIGGVPAFWEDRLYADRERVVRFRIGDLTLDGTNPCQRCVVPTRNPDTGEACEGFRKTFVENRRRTLPTWANEGWFDHYYRLMVNTLVPNSETEAKIAVGDEVRTVGERSGNPQ